MSEDPTLAPIIVGAALALFAAIVLQTTVVPWAQVRTRRRERWEDDVTELTSLLAEDLPRALADFEAVANRERAMLGFRGDPTMDQERIGTLLRDLRQDRGAAEGAVERTQRRLRLLVSRVRRVNPRAPIWFRLRYLDTAVLVSISDFTSAMRDSESIPEPGAWHQLAEKVDQTLSEMTKFMSELEISMRPPSNRSVTRWPQKLLSRLRRIVRPCLLHDDNPGTAGTQSPRQLP